MGLKKYLGLERRRLSRYRTAVDVEFYVWDAAQQKPRTGKAFGRLTEISLEGACLQTSHVLIDGHHILRDNDLEGGTPLVLDLPPSVEGVPRSVKAQIIWYNRISANRAFQFDVGLKFLDISETEKQNLRSLIKSASAP
jgi:hypothetical protein